MASLCHLKGQAVWGNRLAAWYKLPWDPRRKLKTMNVFFSQHLGWAPWERGPLGWLDGRSGAYGGYGHHGEMPNIQEPRDSLSWWETKTRKTSQRKKEMKAIASIAFTSHSVSHL